MPRDTVTTFAEVAGVRKVSKAERWSQQTLAQCAGVSRRTVFLMETRAKSDMSVAVLLRLLAIPQADQASARSNH